MALLWLQEVASDKNQPMADEEEPKGFPEIREDGCGRARCQRCDVQGEEYERIGLRRAILGASTDPTMRAGSRSL